MQVNRVQILIAICLWSVIAGCTQFQAMHNVPKSVDISEGVSWTLQTGKPLQALDSQTVLLTAAFQNKSHQMLVTTEYKQDTLVMVAVSTQGIPLFELALDSQGNVVSKKYVPLEIKPEYILSDIQLVHLPVSKLTHNLVGANVEERSYSAGKRRVIEQHGQAIISIDYQKKSISFEHHQRDYKLVIEAIN